MNIIERAKKIIMNPKEEWEVIAAETTSVQELYISYALILAAIPAVASFIGKSLIGISLGPLGVYRVSVGSALVGAIVQIALTLAGVFVLAYIIDALAPSFGGEKDILASHKLAVYSSTAAWVAGVFNIIPALAVIGALLSLYSLYLFYVGATPVKKVPKDKVLGFTIVVIIVAIIIWAIIGAILGATFYARRI